MNRKSSDKIQNIYSTPSFFFPKIFYRPPAIIIHIFFILLLIPLILTSCSTLPQTSENKIFKKNSNLESLLLDFYSGPLNHLNGVRRGQCPMYPSCSVYSNESLKKHGFFIGWMMACERLMRCGRDELTLAPKVNINGEIKSWDTVTQNDRWWYDTQNGSADGNADIKKGPLPDREGTP